MKKIIVTFLFALIMACGFGKVFAKDITPIRPNIVSVRTVGLYQVSNDITIYKEPHDDAMILYRVRWNDEEFFPETIGAERFFTVLLPQKKLALVEVVDVTDDWVEIVYNNATGQTGWIKKDDPYKFMTWINF